MPRSCNTHQFQPIKHLTHTYLTNSCLNKIIQSYVWSPTKSRGKNMQ